MDYGVKKGVQLIAEELSNPESRAFWLLYPYGRNLSIFATFRSRSCWRTGKIWLKYISTNSTNRMAPIYLKKFLSFFFVQQIMVVLRVFPVRIGFSACPQHGDR